MSPMMFPKMLFSHEGGWNWLSGAHPTVTRMYLLYAVPLSIVPPAMLFYAWHAYGHRLINMMTMNQALMVCVAFFAVELIMVPIMGAVIRSIGEVASAELPYQDAFTLAAVAPTPLWLTPLFLFVPSMLLNVFMLAIALLGAGMLIYQGVPRICHVDDEGKSILLAGSIIAAGLVGWVAMMVLGFVMLGMVTA